MDTIRSICESQPTFCSDLNQDQWCRKDKAAVIRARLAFKNQPDDGQRYHLITAFHDYKFCIEKVAMIKPKNIKARRTTHVEGLLTASNEIERLTRETSGSNNPYLLLYHWTYLSNTDAGDAFLAKEGTDELDKPIFLQALAYHYSDNNIEYSIKLLKRALALSKDAYPANLFDSIATMHFQSGQYEQAYVWTLIAKEMGNKKVNEDMFKRYQSFDSKKFKKLDKQAEQLIDKIEDHQFTYPKVIRIKE